jgi:hypothetical protein
MRAERDLVFTDGDVTPASELAKEIASRKWPRIGAFGGKVEAAWPGNKQPEWAMRDRMMAFGFSRNNYADGEAVYAPPDYPVGPNFWGRNVSCKTHHLSTRHLDQNRNASLEKRHLFWQIFQKPWLPNIVISRCRTLPQDSPLNLHGTMAKEVRLHV